MASETPEMIVRYVDEEMDADERRRMDTAIAADAELASRVALYREMKAALAIRLAGDEERTQLIKTLGNMRGRYFAGGDVAGGRLGGERRGRLITLRRWIGAAAVAASVLIAVTLLWPGRDNYLEKYGGTQMVSGVERGEGGDSILNIAAERFNRGDYAGALPLLDRVIAVDSANQEALFYRGVAGLHVGGGDAARVDGARIDDARVDLNRVYEGQSVYRYEAAFYLALSYAGRKDVGMARKWLDRIPADAPVAEKAKRLREAIK